MNVKLNLTDEEICFLYALVYRLTADTPYRRRRREPRNEAQRAAHKIGMSTRTKLRKAMPKDAAPVFEILNASLTSMGF